MAEQNLNTPLDPSFYHTPANTHIDLFDLGAYPSQTNMPTSAIILIAVNSRGYRHPAGRLDSDL
jgi:hypothetical protein